MSYRRTRAVFLKELHHIIRDVRSLALALAMPFMMLLLYGYALSLDVDRIPTLIFDEDGTAVSRALTRQFQGSRYFDIRGFAASYAAIERAIDKNSILIGVVIPRGFGGDVQSGQGTSVQLLVDGSDSNKSGIAMGYAQSVIQTYSASIHPQSRPIMRTVSTVDARMRVWYNSSLQSRNFVVPGLIAVILMILSGMLTTLTIAREWETGAMEQILSTPLRPSEMVIGKMLAYFVIGVVDSLIALVMGVTIFAVPFRGSILLLAVSTCLFLCVVLFLGILISSGARTQIEAYQLGMLTTFLPGFLLSGFVFAIDTMPKILQIISLIVPARYFVTTLKALFLKGAGLGVIGNQLLFMLIFASIVFWLSVRKLKRQKVD